MDNNPLKNLFAVADLRNRILFTLALLGVYRIGNHIPTPGVNSEALRIMAEQAQNTMFGLYDMFTGGSMSRITIFALGVMPYISASIILQLLTVVVPSLERLSKEGEAGRKKINELTRYLTVPICVVQAVMVVQAIRKRESIEGGMGLAPEGYNSGFDLWWFGFAAVITMPATKAFLPSFVPSLTWRSRVRMTSYPM